MSNLAEVIVTTTPVAAPIIPPDMLVPFSSRETFSDDVCGLPGRDNGCFRWQSAAGRPEHQAESIRANSVSPAPRTPRTLEYIVFRQTKDGLLTAAFYADHAAFRAGNTDNVGCHVARFGFAPKTCSDWTVGAGLTPAFVEYRDDKWRSVLSWLGRGGAAGLAQCFAPGIFDLVDIAVGPRTISVRMSDLVSAYIDTSCKKYRQHRWGKQFGTFQCRFEIDDRTAGGRAALKPHWVSFSYLDPGSYELKQLDAPLLGQWAENSDMFEQAGKVQKLLKVQSQRRPNDGSQHSYVDFFTDALRGQLLPDEISFGRLVFTLGEVAVYLLHWTVIRLLASNEEFRERVFRWKKGEIEFQQVLDVTIELSLEEDLFNPDGLVIRTLSWPRLLATTPWTEMSFEDLLEGFWFDSVEGWDGTVVGAIREFLSEEFSTPNPSARGVRRLPMYRDLDWRWMEPESPDVGAWSTLEHVIRCTTPTGLMDKTEEYYEQLAKQLVRRCVFPLASILSTWPRGAQTLYIFPISDAKVDEQTVPVVFAHVFSRSTAELASGTRNPAEQSPIEALIPVIQAFGRMAAQEPYYETSMRQSVRSELAAAWAHEVKNQTSPLVDGCDDLVNRLRSLAAEQPTLDLAERIETGLITLNAMSIAMHQAVGIADPKTIKPDRAAKQLLLPAKHGTTIVETILQHLLKWKEIDERRRLRLICEPKLWTADELATAREQLLRDYWEREQRPLDAEFSTAILKIRKTRYAHRLWDFGNALNVFGLMRETIGNIRPLIGDLETEYETPPEERTVLIKYKLEKSPSALTLKILQIQLADEDPAGKYWKSQGNILTQAMQGKTGEIISDLRSSRKEGNHYVLEFEHKFNFWIDRGET
jgi:hypothetical protein